MTRRPADPAAAEASHQLLFGNLDIRGRVDAAALVGERLIQDFRLDRVPREAVQEDAARRVRLGQPLEEHVDRDLVRHQLAAIHVPLGNHAEGRLVADCRPEQVARGDVGEAKPLGQDRRLSALARARRSEQDDDSADGRVRLPDGSAVVGCRHRMKPS